LISGQIACVAENKEIDVITSGTPAAFYPLADNQPREISARAITVVVAICIDRSLLKTIITHDKPSSYQVSEIETEPNDDSDWMTQVLQCKLLQHVPANNMMQIMQHINQMPLSSGDVVVRQGEVGDAFYIINSGRCLVARRSEEDGKELKLAELYAGDYFGDESLASGLARNATITMLTNGNVLSLSKAYFNKFIRDSLLDFLSYKQASNEVDEGAIWLDCRNDENCKNNPMEGCLHIPFYDLRGEVKKLDINNRYIAYCDDGSESSAAAFRLIETGYDVYVLKGGLTNSLKKLSATLESEDTIDLDAASWGNDEKLDNSELYDLSEQLSESISQQTVIRNESAQTLRILEDDVARVRREREKFRKLLDEERARHQYDIEQYRLKVSLLEDDKDDLSFKLDSQPLNDEKQPTVVHVSDQEQLNKLNDEMVYLKSDVELSVSRLNNQEQEFQLQITELKKQLVEEKQAFIKIQNNLKAESSIISRLQKDSRVERLLLSKIQTRLTEEKEQVARINEKIQYIGNITADNLLTMGCSQKSPYSFQGDVNHSVAYLPEQKILNCSMNIPWKYAQYDNVLLIGNYKQFAKENKKTWFTNSVAAAILIGILSSAYHVVSQTNWFQTTFQLFI